MFLIYLYEWIVSYVTTHNNESSISINSNGKLSTTIPTPTTTTTHTTTTIINSSISGDIEIKLLNNDEETDQTKHNTSSESIVTLLNANFFKKYVFYWILIIYYDVNC